MNPEPLLELMRSRRSVGPRGLGGPAPSPEQWQAAAEAATRAPDHQGLRPYRFVHVGDDERAALAELFEQAAVEQGRDAEGLAVARQRAAAGPGLLAVVARIRDDVPDVPPHEQWISVGAAVMNLLNALHAMGFGAKVLGGSIARTAAVRRAFCDDGEQLACWVVCGTPDGPRDAAGAPAAAVMRELLTPWSPRRE